MIRAHDVIHQRARDVIRYIRGVFTYGVARDHRAAEIDRAA